MFFKLIHYGKLWDFFRHTITAICYVQHFYISPHNGKYFVIFQIYVLKIFLHKYNRFVHFRKIPAALCLITSFFSFLKLILFIACSLKDSLNFFIQSLPVHTSKLFSMLLNEDIVDMSRHWKIWWNMLAYFCGRWIFRTIFTCINLFYYIFKICTNSKWYFVRFLVLIKF